MAKILTVDDSATLRESLSFVLKTAGHNVIQAENGIEGLEKFKENSDVDLIISDVNMPEMDGLDFLQNLRKLTRDTPVLILTTESEKEKMDIARTFKANAWIVKPFKQQDLLTVVEKLLNK